MKTILIFTVIIALPFWLIFIAIMIKGLRDMKRTKVNPVLLRTGNKIYFFDEGLRCARVVMNFRQDERLLIRTLGRKKERLTINYSQVLEKRDEKRRSNKDSETV